jgi:hypothetical protein
VENGISLLLRLLREATKRLLRSSDLRSSEGDKATDRATDNGVSSLEKSTKQLFRSREGGKIASDKAASSIERKWQRHRQISFFL